MSTWLYQMTPEKLSPDIYRLHIWEDKDWAWPVGTIKADEGARPEPGDTVVFFFAPTNCPEPGFYGWAVVLSWHERGYSGEAVNYDPLFFRPTHPSDYLKMNPYWDETAEALAKKIRGPMTQKTLFQFPNGTEKELRKGISNWLFGKR